MPSPNSQQAESLREFAAQHPVLLLVEQFHEGGYDLSAERWLSEQYGKVSQEWVDGALVARFASVALPEPEGAELLCSDQILSRFRLRPKRDQDCPEIATWKRLVSRLSLSQGRR